MTLARDHPHIDGGEEGREGDPGEDQVDKPIDRPAARCADRRVDQVAVTGVGQATPLEADQVLQPRPMKTTGSEIPTSTKTIAARYGNDLGLSAEDDVTLSSGEIPGATPRAPENESAAASATTISAATNPALPSHPDGVVRAVN